MCVCGPTCHIQIKHSAHLRPNYNSTSIAKLGKMKSTQIVPLKWLYYPFIISEFKITKELFTDRIRRMREGNVFSLSTPRGGTWAMSSQGGTEPGPVTGVPWWGYPNGGVPWWGVPWWEGTVPRQGGYSTPTEGGTPTGGVPRLWRSVCLLRSCRRTFNEGFLFVRFQDSICLCKTKITASSLGNLRAFLSLGTSVTVNGGPAWVKGRIGFRSKQFNLPQDKDTSGSDILSTVLVIGMANYHLTLISKEIHLCSHVSFETFFSGSSFYW